MHSLNNWQILENIVAETLKSKYPGRIEQNYHPKPNARYQIDVVRYRIPRSNENAFLDFLRTEPDHFYEVKYRENNSKVSLKEIAHIYAKADRLDLDIRKFTIVTNTYFEPEVRNFVESNKKKAELIDVFELLLWFRQSRMYKYLPKKDKENILTKLNEITSLKKSYGCSKEGQFLFGVKGVFNNLISIIQNNKQNPLKKDEIQEYRKNQKKMRKIKEQIINPAEFFRIMKQGYTKYYKKFG